MDPIAQAVEAAKAAAAAQGNTVGQAVAVTASAENTAVAVMPIAGASVSMEDLMNGTMVVDGWLKITPDGFKAGEGSKIFEEFDFIIEMVEKKGFTAQTSAKYGNSPVNYLKTYDKDLSNARTLDGKSWTAELARAAQIDPRCKPYPSADLIMKLVTDTGTMKAGQLVGYALSTTNFKHWVKLYRAVKEAGLMGESVMVKAKHIAESKKGNNWGEFDLQLIGSAEQAPD